MRSATNLRPHLSEALFRTEFAGMPECLTKDSEMYLGNKSQELDIYERIPSQSKSINPDACVIDLSAVIRSQASVTKAKTFDDFSSKVIHFVKRLAADIVTDSYHQSSLKAQTRNSRGTGQYFTFFR